MAEHKARTTHTSIFDRHGSGWCAGFTDYPPGGADYQTGAGVREIPPEIPSPSKGYYLQGMNRSDDLFMYLTRLFTPADGLLPGTAYELHATIELASNAPDGTVGVGGSPSNSVYVKVGASATQPTPVFLPGQDVLRLNVDKGNQAIGGNDATVIGDVANTNPVGSTEYAIIQRSGKHAHPVKTDADGHLWVFFGTDSGFEGLTALYYTSVRIELVPTKA